MVRNNREPVILNVAEKPSVARALNQVFSRMNGSVDRGMTRTNGNIQIMRVENVCFPNIYSQGHGNLMPNGSDDVPHVMITTSVRGHLLSRDFDGQQYGWSSCPPSALFTAPIEGHVTPDMEPLKTMLETEARKADALVLWLDCDREGEAIAAEVREVCQTANPRLAQPFGPHCPTKVFRAKFSTVLPNEIQKALRSLGRVNESYVGAVEARSEIDLRVGAAFTRFQTLRLQKKFDGLQDGVISYGPCQFPTLGFVVERWARIETFVPHEFWYMEMKLHLPEDVGDENVPPTTGHNNNNNDNASRTNNAQRSRAVDFAWKRGRLYDRLLTLVLYESCLDAGEAIVTNLTGRPKSRWRPIPLATVELQKRASKYLRLGSETLMTAAEELYQQGFISYPRTETERFQPEFQHRPLIENFRDNIGQGHELAEYASKLLTGNNFQVPKAGPNDDKAHPPITPCRAVDPETINDPTQRSVYILVVKHYLACCSRDALGRETEITVKMASEEFNAKGLMILEKNWLEIYSPWERWSTGQGELPNVQIGSRIIPSALHMREGSTTAPPPISEVELITLMDQNGIGTDATIATHISTIQNREYATKDNQQKFHPTTLGIALIEAYNSMGYQLNKPDLRREMEHECNLVASGRKSKEEIMAPLLAKMRECFDNVTSEAQKLDEAVARHYRRLGTDVGVSSILRENVTRCGICNNTMSLKQAGRGNNNNNNSIRKKLLYCGICNEGYLLPRGEVSAYRDTQGSPHFCPICQFEVVQISAGDGYSGNGYKICPKCYTDSPLDYGGNASGDFKCFSCTHASCSLAGGTIGGNVEVSPCPFCIAGGSITLKKNSAGGYRLGCNNYQTTGCNYTMWLKAAASVSIDEEEHCRRCSVNGKIFRRLKFVWKPGSVPPHLGQEITSCLSCDHNLREDLGITMPLPNQVIPNNRGRDRAVGTNRASRSSSAGRGRGRGRGAPGRGGNGFVCFRCGQPGHLATDCPNN